MAGDWIKMRTDLAEDPAVISIAAATGIDEDHVVGKLHRLWSWADRQTLDGNAAGVTNVWVDRYLNHDGFAAAMQAAGWLVADAQGIRIPNFDRHNGQSAKTRLLTARRVAKHKKSNAASVTDALPREEKSREQKRREEQRMTFDDDGAIDVSIEEARRLAKRIAKWVPCENPDDRSLVAKTAVLSATGRLPQDDVEQALESVQLKKPGNPASWFHRCLENKCKARGEFFNAMLAKVEIPAELERRNGNESAVVPGQPNK